MTLRMTTLGPVSNPDKVSTQYLVPIKQHKCFTLHFTLHYIMLLYALFQQDFWAYPETTERLVNKKLDFVFRKGPSHLRQVSEHVRHHKVAGKKRENRHFSSTCCHFQHTVNAIIQDVLGRVKLVFCLCNIPLTLHHLAVICNPESKRKLYFNRLFPQALPIAA